MNTLKYRSIIGTLGVAILSVFLFTSCEKESEGVPKKPDRLSKFKALTFTGETATTSTTAGSGTFTGNNNNITYTPPGEEPATEFAPALAEGQSFTDPQASGMSQFSVGLGFTMGGGTVNFNNTNYEMALGLCASSDFFGFTNDIDGGSSGTSNDNLDLFIGIAGDFDIDNFEEEDTLENPLGMILYVFSYNGGSSIGNFDDFNDGKDVSNSAFVMAVTFGDNVDDLNLYFATSGSVQFSGSNVTLGGVKMAKVIEDSNFNKLGSQRYNLEAFLECGGFSFTLDNEED